MQDHILAHYPAQPTKEKLVIPVTLAQYQAASRARHHLQIGAIDLKEFERLLTEARLPIDDMRGKLVALKLGGAQEEHQEWLEPKPEGERKSDDADKPKAE